MTFRGNFELPHRPGEDELKAKYPYAVAAHVYDLGVTARVVIGGFAALAVLLIVAPADTFRLIATSIVAGSAGASIFRSLQDRLTAAVAQQETAKTKDTANRVMEKVTAASKAIAEHQRHLAASSEKPKGATHLHVPADARSDPGPIATAENLLAEARGLSEAF